MRAAAGRPRPNQWSAALARCAGRAPASARLPSGPAVGAGSQQIAFRQTHRDRTEVSGGVVAAVTTAYFY
jgi:hypothetical protein